MTRLYLKAAEQALLMNYRRTARKMLRLALGCANRDKSERSNIMKALSALNGY